MHQTSVGQMRGLESNGVAVFRGIPYAKAPLGDLRFAAPERRTPFTETFDATQWGATPQRHSPGFDIPEPVVPGEDILNLNVFAPSDALDGGASLPVLVWIHGGGYVAGCAVGAWYDGREFAADGVVVVSISYRLGFDGFGHLDGAPDNRGILDWICALGWVRDTISSFGGDPGNVTIAGQSAGGGAILSLLATEAARGLFKRAWVMSGVLESTTTAQAALATAEFAQTVGVTPDIDGFASIADTDLQKAVMGMPSMLAFPPITGGKLFPHGIAEGIAAVSHDIDVVIGATADETLWNPAETALAHDDALAMLQSQGVSAEAAALALQHISERYELLPGRILTEKLFRSVIPAVLELRSDATARTWTYDYRWSPVKSGMALHCNEIPAFFGLAEDPTVTPVLGSVPAEVSDMFHGSALRFAKGEALDWQPATGGVLEPATGTCTIDAEGSAPGDGFAAAAHLSALRREPASPSS
ncbi:carboxylesterase family protein [Paeniglutamicibacter kerguelensis]